METPIYVFCYLGAACCHAEQHRIHSGRGSRQHQSWAAGSQQSAASGWYQRQTTMDSFLELGERSLPPSSDVLRGFSDATLDRGEPASALKGIAKLASTGSPCGRTACVPTTSDVPARTSGRTVRPKLLKAYGSTIYGKSLTLRDSSRGIREASAIFMNPPQTLILDPSPRQTWCGKNSDCVMNSQRSALVRGSNPP